MALNYSIAMMGNPMNQEEAKKAYAKAQVSQELSLKALAKRATYPPPTTTTWPDNF